MSKRRLGIGIVLIIAGLGLVVALLVHIFGGSPDVARMEPPVDTTIELAAGTYTLENECDIGFEHLMRACRDALDPLVVDASGQLVTLTGGPSGSNRRTLSQRVPRYAFTVEKGRYQIIAPWVNKPSFRVVLVITEGDVFSGLVTMLLLILGSVLGIVGGILVLLWPVLRKATRRSRAPSH